MKVIIDPGHGGFDPGGGSNAIWKEKDLALKISKYQEQRLKQLGIPVFLTRNGDNFLTPNQRVNIINEIADGDSAIMISNHINNGGSQGGEVIYSIRQGDKLPQMIANELRERGLSIRNVYTRRNSRGQDYYFVIRGSGDNVEPMLIEYGFADNPIDQELLTNDWANLAEGVVKAIADYTQTPYTKPTSQIYKVKNGDSLFKIANKFNTTIQKIKEDNNLTSNDLYIGQDLVIYK